MVTKYVCENDRIYSNSLKINHKISLCFSTKLSSLFSPTFLPLLTEVFLLLKMFLFFCKRPLIKSWLALGSGLGSGTWFGVVNTSHLSVLVHYRIIRPVKVHQKMRKIATKQSNWAKMGPNWPKCCVLYAKKYTTTGNGFSD